MSSTTLDPSRRPPSSTYIKRENEGQASNSRIRDFLAKILSFLFCFSPSDVDESDKLHLLSGRVSISSEGSYSGLDSDASSDSVTFSDESVTPPEIHVLSPKDIERQKKIDSLFALCETIEKNVEKYGERPYTITMGVIKDQQEKAITVEEIKEQYYLPFFREFLKACRRINEEFWEENPMHSDLENPIPEIRNLAAQINDLENPLKNDPIPHIPSPKPILSLETPQGMSHVIGQLQQQIQIAENDQDIVEIRVRITHLKDHYPFAMDMLSEIEQEMEARNEYLMTRELFSGLNP